MMALLRRTAGRLRGLFDRKHEEQALDDELREYLEAPPHSTWREA